MGSRIGDEPPNDIARPVGELAEASLAGGEVQLGDVASGDIPTHREHLGAFDAGQVRIDPLDPLTGGVRSSARHLVGDQHIVGTETCEL